MTRKNIRLVFAIALFGLAVSSCGIMPKAPDAWSSGELKVLSTLWLNNLPPLAADPSNRYADDARALALGRRLFFDRRLSSNQRVACANCHQPERYFTDNLPVSRGISEVKRNAPSLLGAAYSPWFYWDGRRDSQWAQALVPLETPAEHGFDRQRVLQVVTDDDYYRRSYLDLFGVDPDPGRMQGDALNRAFANIGKSIAAFERSLQPGPSRFDDYVAELFGGPRQAQPLTAQEVAGLKLFISDKAQCTRCHNGPLFSNFGFHNIGLVELKRGVSVYDFGRIQGIPKVLQDPYNCLGEFSDARAQDCAELRFIKTKGVELLGAFKVPSLRNIAMTAPYMHDGRFETLIEVIEHYRQAPIGRAGHQELNAIVLVPDQVEQLAAFLKTLTGDQPADVARLPAVRGEQN